MARKPQENPQLDMTPMIDVVFELIIFFVVTIKQEDIFSKLNVNRPAPASSKSESDNDEPCKIEVGKNARNKNQGVYVINGKEMKLSEVDEYLKTTVAGKSKKPEETPIVIRCENQSPHKALVDLLDRCYKYRLFSLSVFSM